MYAILTIYFFNFLVPYYITSVAYLRISEIDTIRSEIPFAYTFLLLSIA